METESDEEQSDIQDAPNHGERTIIICMYAADLQILCKRQLTRRHQFDYPSIRFESIV